MTDPPIIKTATRRGWWWLAWPGLGAQVLLGSSVAVISATAQLPAFAVQAGRYAVAALAVLGLARLVGVRLIRPGRRDIGPVVGGAAFGLVGFNLATIVGTRHSEPAVLGAAVGCIPVVLALIGPLSRRERPARAVVAGALVVSIGAVTVAGLGRADPLGMVMALALVVGEVGFTLLGASALPRIGAWSYSAATCAIAAVVFAVLSVLVERPASAELVHPAAIGAVVYLGVMSTAVAFVLWFTGVRRLGVGSVGLCAGVAAPSATLIGAALGDPLPAPGAWLGMGLIAVGLAIGFGPGSRTRPDRHRPEVDRPGLGSAGSRSAGSHAGRPVSRFRHDETVWSAFPELAAVALVCERDDRREAADVDAVVQHYLEIARTRIAGGPESQLAEIQAWRRIYLRMGLKPTQYRCAAESLLRRLRTSGNLPRLHPLVDLCNALSAAYAIPIATIDLDHVVGDLTVRPAGGDETYQPFGGEPEHPRPGEIIYADSAGTAHSRRWVTRQSSRSAISTGTRRALIVAEAVHQGSEADLAEFLDVLTAELVAWGTPTAARRLGAERPGLALDV